MKMLKGTLYTLVAKWLQRFFVILSVYVCTCAYCHVMTGKHLAVNVLACEMYTVIVLLVGDNV